MMFKEDHKEYIASLEDEHDDLWMVDIGGAESLQDSLKNMSFLDIGVIKLFPS